MWGFATNVKRVSFNYDNLNSEETVKIIWFEVDCGQVQLAKNEICPYSCGHIILIVLILIVSFSECCLLHNISQLIQEIMETLL